MMRSLLTFCLVLFSAFTTQAQSNTLVISGIVSNLQTGEGQANQEVFVTWVNNNLELVSITNQEGWYSFEIADGSVIGPNQTFNVSTVDACSGLTLIDTVINNQGTIDEIEVNFSVCSSSGNDCEASFSWYVSPNNPYRIIFEDNSDSQSEYARLWDVGNNILYTTEIVEHTFEEAGAYEVCLTINGNDCSDTFCAEVIVPGENSNEDCNPFFEYTVETVNEEGIYILSLHSIDVPPNSPVEHQWLIPGLQTQFGSNPQVEIVEAGEYSVCHIVVGEFCVDTLCQTVVIGQNEPECEAYFAASISQFDPFRVVCENQSFTANQEATYLWDFGNEIYYTTLNVEHNFNQSGPYEICLTVTTENCTDTYCQTIYVPGNAPNQFEIGGQVFAGSNYADLGSVRLYQIDPISGSSELIQTTQIDTLGYYLFSQVDQGTYLIKAGLNENSSYFGSYVPTYFGSQFYWQDAEPVTLTESGYSYTIALIYSSNPGGEGWVNGNIDDGPYRLNVSGLGSSAALIPNADVYVTDLNGSAQQYQLTNTEGEFYFSNLAYGTYQLIADVPGMICVPIEFTLSPDFQGATINMVMGDEITSIATLTEDEVGLVYPNPASNKVFVSIDLKSNQHISSFLSTTSGQLLWHTTHSLAKGQHVIEVPLDQAANGIYFLSLRNANQEIIGMHKISVNR